MNKKGFKLVELLAVLVIMAIMVIISTVAVGALINKSKTKRAAIYEENLLDAAVTYAYLARITCPNNDLGNNVVKNCFISNCPADFIVRKSGKPAVNTKYSSTSATYKNCALQITASTIFNGEGINRDYNEGDYSVTSKSGELYPEAKERCNASGKILIYKDTYGSIEAISLTSGLCNK